MRHGKRATITKRIAGVVIALGMVLSILVNAVDLVADESDTQQNLSEDDKQLTDLKELELKEAKSTANEQQNEPGKDEQQAEDPVDETDQNTLVLDQEDSGVESTDTGKTEKEDPQKNGESGSEKTEAIDNQESQDSENSQDQGTDNPEGEEEPPADSEEQTEATEVTAQGISLSNLAVGVSSILPTGNKNNIAVIRLSDQSYTTYPSSAAGLRQALFFMYQNGSGAGDDYILYFGSNLNISATADSTIVAQVIPSVPSAADMTFYALQGKIGTLVLTGTYEDPLNENTNSPTDARTVNIGGGTYGNDWHMGTPTVLRNIRYTAKSIYGNGNNLTLAGGSFHTQGMNIYGGAASNTIDGNIELEIYSTGTGTANIYGGNYSGAVNGNITTIIRNTSGAVNIYGGNDSGTVNGNISTTVHKAGSGDVNFYGGGKGTSDNRITVQGDITNELHLGSGSLGSYYGAAEYANVTGTVRNTISGPGSNANSNKIIGGTRGGNIGSDRNSDAIVNTVDLREYTGTYRKHFVGANGNSDNGIEAGGANDTVGIITGNITNVVSAGEYNTGGMITGVSGGGDYGTRMGGGTKANGFDDAQTAKAAASFQVYGNIYTTLTGGCYSRGLDGTDYARAAGYGGYIEGDTTIEVGTESLAYGRSKPTGNLYFVSANGRSGADMGLQSIWDIVGGGGKEDQGESIYIKGNTKVIHINTLARWTYGGNFGGTIEGNTTNELFNGRVDTLEGSGYRGYLVKGGVSQSIMHGGQVDWFLVGGSWGDRRNENDVKLTVEGGIINAHVGGNYGIASDDVVTGDCEINISGGDFRGYSRAATGANASAPKVISGGPAQYGTLEGNITINIDYSQNSDPNAKFELPPNCYISGGTAYGASSAVKVGTPLGETSIIMNIKAGGDGSTDALDGVSIYGDGGEQTSNAFNSPTGSMCYAKNIVMNIDAPGSSIGQLYATNSVNALKRNVEINVTNAASIYGINGGSARGGVNSDNYTNTVVTTAGTFGGVPNRAKINVGTAEGESFFFTIGAGGIKNFTDLTVDHAIFFANGTVVNGSGAENTNVENRITNHGSSYSNFGDITLKNNAGFGISNAYYAVGGKLTVDGEESTITSPSGRGRFIITDYIPNESRMLWSRNGGDGTFPHTGTWFGSNQYYRVFTFSPLSNRVNAEHIIPTGFRGIDPNTYKTYIGDNSPTDGYGLALPGSFIEYQVVEPKGDIKHNVVEASDGTDGVLPIKAYGTVKANVPAQSGILAIPTASNITPTLTFTPAMKEGEPETPEYWIKGISIDASDGPLGQSSHSQEIGESTNYDPDTWTSSGLDFSYLIDAAFTNEAEVSGNSILVTEDEAAEITDIDALIAIMEASGRPFFAHNIDDNLLSAIKVPLDDNAYARKHEITYNAGVSETPNSQSIIRNVVVVKNGTTLSDDRSVGIYAIDAQMFLETANALVDQADLDANHTKAIAIDNDGFTHSPTITNGGFETIHDSTELKSVPVDYSFTGSGESPQTVTKTVTVEIVKTTVPFTFIKVDDRRENQAPLKGAVFKLYHNSEELPMALVTEQSISDGDWTLFSEKSSGDDGVIDFGELESGYYMLVESKAPIGFEAPVGQWQVTIDVHATNPIVIQGKERGGAGLPPAFIVEEESGVKSYLLPNYKQFALPFSGNRGIYGFISAGLVTIVGSVTGYCLKQKRSRAKLKKNLIGSLRMRF